VLSGIDANERAMVWVETSMQSVFDFAEGHHQADDITVMALRILPGKA